MDDHAERGGGRVRRPGRDDPRTAGYAMNRAVDDEIFGALYATAYTGHSGSTAVTWPNGNAESTPTAPTGTQMAPMPTSACRSGRATG